MSVEPGMDTSPPGSVTALSDSPLDSPLQQRHQQEEIHQNTPYTGSMDSCLLDSPMMQCRHQRSLQDFAQDFTQDFTAPSDLEDAVSRNSFDEDAVSQDDSFDNNAENTLEDFSDHSSGGGEVADEEAVAVGQEYRFEENDLCNTISDSCVQEPLVLNIVPESSLTLSNLNKETSQFPSFDALNDFDEPLYDNVNMSSLDYDSLPSMDHTDTYEPEPVPDKYPTVYEPVPDEFPAVPDPVLLELSSSGGNDNAFFLTTSSTETVLRQGEAEEDEDGYAVEPTSEDGAEDSNASHEDGTADLKDTPLGAGTREASESQHTRKPIVETSGRTSESTVETPV